MDAAALVIARDDPRRADIHQLLDEHLADMFATSPAESVHALDHAALLGADIAFWSVRENGDLLACGALREIDPRWAELKSMRTTPAARGRGVATALLDALIADARRRGIQLLSLETGAEEYFARARRLYARAGFVRCPPFADYTDDPHSEYFELRLD
ncbi:GNAT family N-acetyltransferase [Marisediminicola senii]|uniref:GNAT family N-acetyltransferase n=1 Tax=Marisediminicola senii TaxID=2711233 RepID=UPI0013EABBA3|nr:GNAT family N-acetyltransferase [Marisediminicola senii]